MPATETFGIEVEIAPKVADGARKVDDALAGMEKHAKSTGEVVSKALGGAVAEAAHKAAGGASEIAAAFAKMEAAALPAVRAEREYAAAVQLAREAVAAGVATEAQAKALIDAKAESLGKLTDATKGHGETMATSIQNTLKSNSGFMEAVDIVGKLGLAMGTVNQAFALGKVAVSTYHVAMAGLRSLFAGGGGQRMQWEGETPLERMAREAAERNAKDKADFVDRTITGVFGADVDSEANMERRRRAREEAKMRDELATYAENQRKEVALARRQAEQQASWDLARQRADEAAARKAARGSRGAGVAMDAPSGWDDFAAEIRMASDAFDDMTAKVVEFDQLTELAKIFVGLGDDLVTGMRDLAEATDDAAEATRRLYTIPPPPVGEWAKLGDQIKGPLKSAFSGMVDQIATMTFDLKSMFRSLAEDIARVLIQMLALQAIKAAFSSTTGGLGGFLWDIAGGAPGGGGTARQAPGDSFGGGASNAGGGAVFREAVPRGGGGGGSSERQAPQVNVKSVVVADFAGLIREQLQSKEAERIIVTHVAANRGKLGGR